MIPPEVSLKIALLIEALATHFALERFGALVNGFEMSDEIAQGSEASMAEFTLKGLFVGVRSHVDVQLGPGSTELSADIARDLVYVSHVWFCSKIWIGLALERVSI